METVPIACLGPSLSNPESRRIRAIVTLIWPYSSSTKSIAVLLVEPDFRLRAKRGQVRVQLRGASAAALACTRIGSGDEILLHLEGVQWVETTPGISTPGKSVDTELLFKRRLVCQVIRDGQELANLDVDDDIVSERSRSASPSTPIQPYFAYATPRLSQLNSLSTPASSAFHKRARVSGGSLVDSPYDPFVTQSRRAGEPERKKARHSWGSEARWRVECEIPSPTKEDRASDWIQDEDLASPKKQSRTAMPLDEPQSPVSQPLPTAAKVTDSQFDETTTRYTQELVNLVSGDTEEDSDMDEIQSSTSAIPDRVGRRDSYDSPLRQSFSIFRDFPAAEKNGDIQRDMEFEAQELPEFAVPLEIASLQGGEEDFFTIPSSDSHEAITGVQKDADYRARDTRSSSLLQDATSLQRGHFARESLQRKSSEGESLERKSPERGSQKGSSSERESLERISPQRGFLVRQLLEAEDNIDPSLQERTAAASVMAPPSVPWIQTSNFNSGQVTPMEPPSTLPRSPRTPDLRPQQSATLPLPSPFPGDELATSYMDDASDWQPTTDFTTPLRRSLPDFGFGFGFHSDGLHRRYSTETDQRDAYSDMRLQFESMRPQGEQDALQDGPSAGISMPEAFFLAPVPKEGVALAESQDEPRFEDPQPEATVSDQVLYEDMVSELPLNEFQMGHTNEPLSLQALAEMAGDDMNDESFQPPKVEYPELPSPEEIHGHGSEATAYEEEHDPTMSNYQASKAPVSYIAISHDDFLQTEHAAFPGHEKEEEAEQESIYNDEDEEEEEYSDEDVDESEDEDEDGEVQIGAGRRFGPPLDEPMAPPATAPVVINLLSDSDGGSSEEEEEEEEESDLESVDGDEEEARVAQARVVGDEADDHPAPEKEDQEEDDVPEYDGEEEGHEDEDEMESSGLEDDDDLDQGMTTHPLEPSGSQDIPSFDGASDPRPPDLAPALMSDDLLPVSTPSLGVPHSSTVTSSIPVATPRYRIPSSTASPSQTSKAVVIDLGSDEEDENVPNMTLLPVLRDEFGNGTEIGDTFEPSSIANKLMEDGDYAPADATYEHMEEQPILPSESGHGKMAPTAQTPTVEDIGKPDTIKPGSPPSVRRSAVTFAPRVSRRRAPGGSQLTMQLELQSSQPLVSSQASFRRPRLIIEDTFEGMIDPDGSITTTCPSSRGQDSAETSDEEDDVALTQTRDTIDDPAHDPKDYNTQLGSLPPALISGDEQISYPDLPSIPENEANEPRPYISQARSRPQHSTAQSVLITPNESQLTHSQPSFTSAEQDTDLPLTPQLSQTTPKLRWQNPPRDPELQQPLEDELREHEKLNQKINEAMIRNAPDVTSTSLDLSDSMTSKPSLTVRNALKEELSFSEAMLEQSDKLSQKLGRTIDGSSFEADVTSTSQHKSDTMPNNISPWFAPRRSNQRHRGSSSPQPYEDEATRESQTSRGDRFDRQNVGHLDQDHLPFSQLDEATIGAKVPILPPVKDKAIKPELLEEESQDETEDYLSSQIPTSFSFSHTQSSQTKGLLTSLSYYTPLSNLMTRVSTQSSQSYNDAGADIIAVVTKSSTKPLRAEKGPKDYGTTFLISDPDFWPNKVTAKVFRPWKMALPVVQPGDVILLRGFDVLPQTGGVGIGLRSAEGSAWCVWQFGIEADENDMFSDVPIWTQKEKRGQEPTLEEREDARGPPVERGDEERQFVQELRKWWVDESEQTKGKWG